ncbi:MAG: ATP-dependent metallopeptidase FtsH/Yme1/Tma family protein [Elusimicrobium sp.]|uniref:ATP-dependent zinc metalloprotease FtsH n=1 Tax=Candidatus Avelusimicrobium gallicola TaxID=2562704 RepID=A0A928DS23_9BACT|nr:ATP-dependent metallopeptidase FtsH/Yme1/Tma family protein [Elusimicrobium sp.]
MMKNKNPNNRKIVSFGQILGWLIIFALAVFFFNKPGVKEAVLDYSEFKHKVAAAEVSDLTVAPGMISGMYKNEQGQFAPFRTVRMEDPNLVQELTAANVKYKAQQDRSWIGSILFNVLWIVLLIGLWWFIFIRPQRNDGRSAMNFARSKAKMQDPSKQSVTFKDVAGCDEAKEELQDVIKFLKNPKKFQKLGGKLPKGVLLYGAPGTGKTLLAKAVAGEAGVSFFSASASEFVEMFVGVGAARVRDLFDQAKKNSPAIIFIDELDAVGRRRFAGIGGGHDEREQTLNQLLIELDGFESKQGIILMASTNRPDVLDPALIRPGRFDRHISVPAPDLKGREEILKVHAKKVKLSAEVDLKTVAKGTPGFVGADLANVINEAAILAARADKDAVTKTDMDEAVERVIAGPQKKSRIISKHEQRIIAAHEVGHTVVARMTNHSDPVHKVTIIPRGQALGYTLQLPLEDKFLTSKSELLDKLCILLAGRAAEEIVFGEITSGASDDLNKTMAYARKMVTELGMSEKLGPVALPSGEEGEVFLGRDISRHNTYSQELAKTIDEEILNLIKSSYTRAKDIITRNRAAFDKLVETLLEKEVVESNEIDEILGLKPVAKEDAPLEPAAEENPQEETQEPKAEQAEPRQPELFE